nr:hypothetical protein [Tanacetum cinerariifolium]
MGRDTVQLETVVSTISQEYLLEFTSEYGILKDLHPELPTPEERIVDFSEGKTGAQVLQRMRCQPGTPIPRRLYGFVQFDPCSEPYQGKDWYSPPRCSRSSPFDRHYEPGNRNGRSSHSNRFFRGTSPIERSPLDFTNENPSQQSTKGNGTKDQGQGTVAPKVLPSENVTTTGVAPEADMNASPKVLRRDHAESQPTQSTIRGKSLAVMGIGMGSTCPIPTSRDTVVDVSDPDPLSFANPQSVPIENVAQYANISYSSVLDLDLPKERPSLDIRNRSIPPLPPWSASPGYFSELRHLHNDDFLKQYNINLARQVAMGSQLRLRFEQEAKLLKKSVAQVARRDQGIQAKENEIKNLEALLEAETDMKKTAEAKNTELGKKLENLRALFSDLQVSNDRLSQQVSTLQAQVTREEKIKAAFEEFKQYENDRVEKRCAEIDARLDALSIDFDEKLYPHMLSAIAGRRWVIGYGLRLAIIKCGESIELRQMFVDVVSAGITKGMSEGLKYEVEHGKANLDLEAIEAYESKADAKYVTALHTLRDLKYPMVDQLESLKDAPIDVIMASLHLESTTGDDAPQWIRELRPSSSQLRIPVYPEVSDPKYPWAFKEEILLADAIAANVSRVEKKKKCRVTLLHKRRHPRMGPLTIRHNLD